MLALCWMASGLENRAPGKPGRVRLLKHPPNRPSWGRVIPAYLSHAHARVRTITGLRARNPGFACTESACRVRFPGGPPNLMLTAQARGAALYTAETGQIAWNGTARYRGERPYPSRGTTGPTLRTLGLQVRLLPGVPILSPGRRTRLAPSEGVVRVFDSLSGDHCREHGDLLPCFYRWELRVLACSNLRELTRAAERISGWTPIQQGT